MVKAYILKQLTTQRLNLFFDLTSEYAFGNMLIVLVLVMILLGLTWKVKNKTFSVRKDSMNEGADVVFGKQSKLPWSLPQKAIVLTLVVTIGYFLVVAKTALLNAEEAIRYEMPIYGLFILLVVLCLDKQAAAFTTEKNQKWMNAVMACLMGLVLLGQLYGLAQGKVCFLYQQDARNVAWAEENHEEPVAYIYNTANQWMIWDDSEELMQYDEIYFISSGQESIVPDKKLSGTEHSYVYKMRGEDADAVFEKLVEVNGGFREINLIRELLYCDLYELKR